MKSISRRGLLQGLVAGAVVLGFDPASRSWVTEARASGVLASVPALDGTVTTDASVLASHADDFGHIVHRTPLAVLFPGSVSDIVKMVRFARAHCLSIGPRGRGHTAFGQSQVDAGIVIDMGSLDEIHELCDDHAVVDAGVVWRDLLLATTAVGRTPPVLTDFLGLTVGGTLSVGGVSGRSYLHGAQVDNVISLQVVTGEGELLTCSPDQRPKLFDAALAGLGLCCIIVRATIRLIAAKSLARTHRAFYTDIPSMLDDIRMLAAERRFDHLRGNALPSPDGWAYYVEGTTYHTPGDTFAQSRVDKHRGLPDDPFEGLQSIPGSEQIEEQSYFDYCDAVGRLVALLDQLGLGGVPHPWLDLFVPDSEVDEFASSAVDALDPSTLLPGSVVLFFPFKRAKLNAPLLRVPDEPTFFLFDILRANPPVPAIVDASLAHNRELFEENRELGGKHYTISAIELSHHDYKRHFQPEWGALKSAKNKFDPDNVLGAGPGVFP